MYEENKRIGKHIRYLRVKKGLSQQVLAELVGYTSRSSIAKIESGEIDLPFSKISQFANVLNSTVPELTGNILESTDASIVGWEESPIQKKYNHLTNEQKKIIDMLLDEFTK